MNMGLYGMLFTRLSNLPYVGGSTLKVKGEVKDKEIKESIKKEVIYTMDLFVAYVEWRESLEFQNNLNYDDAVFESKINCKLGEETLKLMKDRYDRCHAKKVKIRELEEELLILREYLRKEGIKLM